MRHPTRTRYAWRIDGATIYVWMPTTVAGHRRRLWLEAHVRDANPRRFGEAARVQAMIDQHFGTPRVVSLSDRSAADCANQLHLAHQSQSEGELPIDLATIIADEKSKEIQKQRPAIRALGPLQLRQLILEIFQGMTEGNYNQQQVATTYQLTTPSLSRFAGKDWKSVGHMPDLWMNCAKVLAENDDFIESAIAAGVWEVVSAVFENSRRTEAEGANNEP